jgi:chromosome segregation ATPase
MFGSWLEAVIIVVILTGMGVAIFKGGAANPVGTGSLNRKLARVETDIGSLKDDYHRIEARVTEIDRRAATVADIERIEARLTDWERKIDRLDERMDILDCKVTQLETVATANQTVVAAIAESLRETSAQIHKIERLAEASAAITAKVPGFIENVLTSVARTTAQTEHNAQQVERLYDFIVERGMSK